MTIQNRRGKMIAFGQLIRNEEFIKRSWKERLKKSVAGEDRG